MLSPYHRVAMLSATTTNPCIVHRLASMQKGVFVMCPITPLRSIQRFVLLALTLCLAFSMSAADTPEEMALAATMSRLDATSGQYMPSGGYPQAPMGYASSGGYPQTSTGYPQTSAGYAASGSAYYPTPSSAMAGSGYGQPYSSGQPYPTGYATTPQSGYSTMPSAGYAQPYATTGGMTTGYATTLGMAPGMAPRPLGPSTSSGLMSAEEAERVFDDIITEVSPLESNEDFNTTLQQLEDLFNRCNFARTTESSTVGVTTTTLVTKAAKAIEKIMSTVNSSWDKFQRKIAKAVTSDLSATQNTSEQAKCIATAYMFAAAVHNKSFINGLAGHTLSDIAKKFWESLSTVFSTQPVSRRVKTASGEWREDAGEKALIEDLFQAEQLLNKAQDKLGTIDKSEEALFVQGTRKLSSILIKPAFARGSIGLQTFAFLIFKEGVLKWLKSLGAAVARHDELWIVGAEAFNIIYSGFVGTDITLPKDTSAFGANRPNGFASDHIVFSSGKGSVSMTLQSTKLNSYTQDMKNIADTFTKRHNAIGGQASLVAKNQSDFLVLMMCSEACEYSMSETQAPETANLMTYFFEKGFAFNNRLLDWNQISTTCGCLTIVTLSRLVQRVATSRLTTMLGLDKSRSSALGDYTASGIYHALDQAFVTILDAITRFPIIGTKLNPLLKTLKTDKAELEKYMRAKSDLKGFKPRPRVFEQVRVTMQTLSSGMNGAIAGMQPAYGMQPARPGYPMQTARPGYPMTSARPGYPMQTGRPGYPQSARSGYTSYGPAPIGAY